MYARSVTGSGIWEIGYIREEQKGREDIGMYLSYCVLCVCAAMYPYVHNEMRNARIDIAVPFVLFPFLSCSYYWIACHAE